MTWLLFVLAGFVMIYLYLQRIGALGISRGFMAKNDDDSKRGKSSLPVDSESQYLLCTFSLAAKVIAADGEIAPEEEERLRGVMKQDLNLSEKEEKLAWKIFKNAIDDDLEMRDYADAFRRYFPDRVQLKDKVIVTLLSLA